MAEQESSDDESQPDEPAGENQGGWKWTGQAWIKAPEAAALAVIGPAPLRVRFSAYLLDYLIVQIPAQILAFTIGDAKQYYQALLKSNTGVVVVPQALVAADLAGTVIAALYFVYMWTGSGQTVGMRLVGLEVVDVTTRMPLSISNAIKRSLVFWVPDIFDILIFPISQPLKLFVFLSTRWNPERRGLHDRLSASMVIAGRERPYMTPLAAATLAIAGFFVLGSVLTTVIAS